MTSTQEILDNVDVPWQQDHRRPNVDFLTFTKDGKDLLFFMDSLRDEYPDAKDIINYNVGLVRDLLREPENLSPAVRESFEIIYFKLKVVFGEDNVQALLDNKEYLR